MDLRGDAHLPAGGGPLDEKIIDETRKLYEHIFLVMSAHAKQAQLANKKIIFLVGEEHRGYGSPLLTAMIYDIAAKHFAVKHVLHEADLVGRHSSDSEFIKELKMESKSIETFHTVEYQEVFLKKNSPVEYHHKRNEEMSKNINSHAANAVVLIGSGHFQGLLKEYPINSHYHVCSLNTYARQLTQEETKYNSPESARKRYPNAERDLNLVKKELRGKLELYQWSNNARRVGQLNEQFQVENVLVAINDDKLLTELAVKLKKQEKDFLNEELNSYEILNFSRQSDSVIQLPYPSDSLLKQINQDNLYRVVATISAKFNPAVHSTSELSSTAKTMTVMEHHPDNKVQSSINLDNSGNKDTYLLATQNNMSVTTKVEIPLDDQKKYDDLDKAEKFSRPFTHRKP